MSTGCCMEAMNHGNLPPKTKSTPYTLHVSQLDHQVYIKNSISHLPAGTPVRERERESEWRRNREREREKEGERESQAGSVLPAQNPTRGSNSRNGEIMT